jgi:hypothetical protein
MSCVYENTACMQSLLRHSLAITGRTAPQSSTATNMIASVIIRDLGGGESGHKRFSHIH